MKLAPLRRALGIGQDEAAGWLGQSVATYSRIETGEMAPNLDQLRALSEGFGMPIDYLVATGPRIEDRLVAHIQAAVANAKRKKEAA